MVFEGIGMAEIHKLNSACHHHRKNRFDPDESSNYILLAEKCRSYASRWMKSGNENCNNCR